MKLKLGDLGPEIGPGTPDGARRYGVRAVVLEHVLLGQEIENGSEEPLVVTKIDYHEGTIDVLARSSGLGYFGPAARR